MKTNFYYQQQSSVKYYNQQEKVADVILEVLTLFSPLFTPAGLN